MPNPTAAILVIGDPTEEVPIIDLRIRDALKGVPPAELMPHGVPIADLRLKEHAPLDSRKLAVAAPWTTGLMDIAGTAIRYGAGQETELLETLAALAAGRNVEADDALRAAAELLRGAQKPVIVYGGLVLDNPVAAKAAASLIRSAGARPMIMGPAANSFGLELTGVLPGDGGHSYGDMFTGNLRGLIVSQLDPALNPEIADVLNRTELVVLHTMFHGPGSEVADVILPALSGLEKDGTFINLEGRALPVRAAPTDHGLSQDFTGVVRALGEARGRRLDGRSVRSARRKLQKDMGLDFAELEVEGVILDLSARKYMSRRNQAESQPVAGVGLDVLITPSMLRHEHLERNPHLLADRGFTPLRVNPADAGQLDLRSGDQVTMTVGGMRRRAEVILTDKVPTGLMLLPALPEQPSGLRSAPAESFRHERQALEVI